MNIARSRCFSIGFFFVVWIFACTNGGTHKPTRTGPPKRIVSQTVLSDEILWDLGPSARARVVGISAMADDARYSLVPDHWPPEIPRMAGTAEALVASGPDLVIMAGFTRPETQALVRASGIPTLMLHGFQGFDDYRTHVRDIAQTTGETRAGNVLVETFDVRLRTLRQQPAVTALGCVSTQQGIVAAAGTTFDDEARAAGLRNLAAEHGWAGHVAVPLEEIVTWNPDIVVTACTGDCEATANTLATSPGWSATAAARDGRVVAIEARVLSATGRGMLDAVEQLQHIRNAKP